MTTEGEIRTRIKKRKERLGNLRRVQAQIDAGTVEKFEALDGVGKRAVFDADPEIFRRHYEEIRERNVRKLMVGQ